MNWSKWKQRFMDWWLLLVPATFALGAITTYAVAFRSMSAMEDPAAWGTFGDFIGGLMNPLVSVLTLFVAISVWRLQKAELELTRNEMAQTKDAMEDQAKTAEQQRREQRFFDFLSIYRSTVDSIEFEISNSAGSVVTYKGKRAFKFLTTADRSSNPFQYFVDLFESGHWEQWFAKPINSDVQQHWAAESPVLDHYFRVVFTLLREAEPTLKDDCWRYMKLLRAQLSRDEVNLLAMNLIFDDEGQRMRALIEQYGMLKHMSACALRNKAEQVLHPKSFGRTWATQRLLNSANHHAP